jgi:hypothetical protein
MMVDDSDDGINYYWGNRKEFVVQFDSDKWRVELDFEEIRFKRKSNKSIKDDTDK